MNKKGGLILAEQTVLWIIKIILFLFAIAIILWPIGCYINRNVEDGRGESFIVMKKAAACLDKNGFDEDKLNSCMKQDRYGIKISSGDKEIVFNKQKYSDKIFCDKEGYFCREETKKIGNEKFKIEVVVKSE